MQKSMKKRFFPLPPYLSMPAYGLDISDESIRFARLYTAKESVQLEKFGEVKVPAGIISSGQIKNPEKLAEILTLLRKENEINCVRVSLPEEQVYVVKFLLPKQGLGAIREGIELVLEDHVPISTQEAIFDYDLLEEQADGLLVQVAAVQASVAEGYLEVFEKAGMIVKSLELEAQAISRTVVKKGDLDSYMIVDFGEKRTGIFIISAGAVAFTSTLEYGGVQLSEMIQKNFKVSFEEAEEIKKTYGLQRNLENKEIFPVLLNGLSILRDEISKHLLYWHTHGSENNKPNSPIKKIFLCGGNANIVGLSDYLSVSLKSRAETADVWINILPKFRHFVPELDLERSLSFATSLGLALGDYEND